MNPVRLLLVVVMASLVISGSATSQTAAAGKPRVTQVVLTDVVDGTQNKTLFGTTTPSIYAYFWLDQVPSNTTLTCVWVAEKTAVAAPNYQIDRVELKVGGLINRGQCSLSKPTNNWPAGDYRLDIYLGTEVSAGARFRIR
ncbi:MAG TPA: hypothetical protein VGR24_13125 [bacterium]|nr:hypothetical protein [bacterium]